MVIKKFSSPKMRNRQFVFTPKIEYELVAESLLRRDKLREANLSNLQFPTWCIFTVRLETILSKIPDSPRFARQERNQTLGRAKRKGVGGNEFLPALASEICTPPHFNK